eukprot:4743916-Pyramimonas_sp.AAC.1
MARLATAVAISGELDLELALYLVLLASFIAGSHGQDFRRTARDEPLLDSEVLLDLPLHLDEGVHAVRVENE